MPRGEISARDFETKTKTEEGRDCNRADSWMRVSFFLVSSRIKNGSCSRSRLVCLAGIKLAVNDLHTIKS